MCDAYDKRCTAALFVVVTRNLRNVDRFDVIATVYSICIDSTYNVPLSVMFLLDNRLMSAGYGARPRLFNNSLFSSMFFMRSSSYSSTAFRPTVEHQSCHPAGGRAAAMQVQRQIQY